VSRDERWRYDGKRVVVTGCASGIGEHVARQLTELGAEVVGLDLKRPALQLKEFHEVDLADAASIDRAVTAVGRPVDALFNVAGVSSGIGDPLKVVTINFLGTRRFTEALVPKMPPGSAIANVSSLAASAYRENATVTAGLLVTQTMADGIEWCLRNPAPVADGGGYRLSKEAIILYGMASVGALGAKGIRINCTGPGVTDTPILDQLRSAYGQEFLESFQTPLGRVAGPDEQASALVFLNSDAARYISGQVLWVDGGAVAERVFGDVIDERLRARVGAPPARGAGGEHQQLEADHGQPG
jgi:NAD(P)-dependent dehydrogenase (short-subunit alcohol dehydrogenase family)